MADREPISKVDTAWLRMEQPSNLMMITGVIFLSPEIRYDDLLAVIDNRFLAFSRFRCKAVASAAGCWWEEDADFDLRAHVRRAALPGAADFAELEEYVSDLASTPLEAHRPRWQFHLIENYRGGPVLVTRIHHCYADGIALIQVMLSLTEGDAAASLAQRSPVAWQARKARESSIFRRLAKPARDGLGSALELAGKAADEIVQILNEPSQLAEYTEAAGRYTRIASEIADELGGVLLLPDDPPSVFKGAIGSRKRVAWAAPLPLDEVKAVSRVLGATVNDVLIAAITGALRAYLFDRGTDPDGLTIRATVPVNLRPLEHARELGNHFGLVYLPLPVGEPNPLGRLYQIHEAMEELKASRQAAVAFGLLAALGMAPAVVQKPVLEMMSRKASTVLTNVPGPRQTLYLAGAAIREMMFWVPQTGTIGMGISILTYHDKVFCGMMTDRRRVPDPHAITRHFKHEFDKMLYATLLLDPDSIADAELAAAMLT